MIQLYRNGNTNYAKNGDETLQPYECFTDCTLNGDWIGTLRHPIDKEGKWELLQQDAVIKLPFFDGSDQLFQIVNYVVDDVKGVTCDLEHIFFSSMDDCWIDDIRPTNVNGQSALNSIITNPKYSGQSNISRTATAYYVDRNLMDAINGDDDNSFINRWGGEIFFDNFKVIINDRIGSDRGTTIQYGKNMNGMNISTDFRDVVTVIKPKAYNGYGMTENGCVSSSNIDKYRVIKKKSMTFSNVKMRIDAQEDDEENGYIVCDTQAELDQALRQECLAQFEAGVDVPSVTGSINLVLLQNTKEYEDVKSLETVSLGDTVHCYNRKIKVTSDARVVNLVWDALKKKVKSVEIGDLSYNYFDNVDSTMNAVNTVIDVGNRSIRAEKINGVINGARAQLNAQRTIANKMAFRAMKMEDLDPESPTYGATCYGTGGLEFANEKLPNGDWDWQNAFGPYGLIANAIITGLLQSKDGKFYVDLDKGIIKLADAEFSGTINGSNITGSNIKGGTFDVDNDIFIGNWVYLDNNKTSSQGFGASGMKLGSAEVKGPLLNMWGIADQSGYIHLIPLSEDESVRIYMINAGSEKNMQINTPLLTINGKAGLTGTYVVERSITTEQGFVVGVD